MSSVESQFHTPPFPSFPSAQRYVAVGSQDDALQRVRRGLEAWEAICLVIGPPGTGKSLLCQVLKEQFAGKREVVVFGDAMLQSPISLQRHLLSRLNRVRGIHSQPVEPGDDPQVELMERLASSGSEFPGLVLLVDEAQSLAPETLETIRILTNVMSDGQPCVSAVLLGGPKLDETLSLPSLEALSQRVATRCYLHPLNSDETVQYVQSVIQDCGSEPSEAIEESAIRAIHNACSGVPRLINQLMTSAIDCAASSGNAVITCQMVDQAWAQLQQLPGPMLDEPAIQQPSSTVEFGPLSEDTEQQEGQVEIAGSVSADVDCESTNAELDCETESLESEHFDSEIKETVTCENQNSELGICETESCEIESCNADDDAADRCESELLETEACESLEETMKDCMTEETEPVASDSVGELSVAETGFQEISIEALESLSFDCQSVGDFSQLASCEVTNQWDGEQELSSESTAENESCESHPVGESLGDVSRDPTPSQDELFGQFEEEEEIGASAVETPPVALSSPNESGHSACEPSDLEASLHEEILSLRGVAASSDCDESDADEGNVSRVEQPSLTASAVKPPVLWMDDDSSDAAIHDDRDMLVIEDDIQVEGAELINEVAPVEQDGAAIAVDFQAMLAKMRSPQE